jgi:cytochrome d ubiquinol oxidase subunit I
MLNPASLHETIHMVLAAYVATAFLVAGIHAFFLLRDPQSVFHRASCSIALVVACVSIPLQIFSGDFAAREVAKLQPPKLAAMEAHYETGTGVPLVIGGIPDDAARKINYGLQIQFGLSLLVGYNPATKVVGLEDFPRDQWPNVRLVHWSFYGFMRTKDAVTPMPGLVVPFTTFTIVYLLLATIVIFLLRRQFMETHPRWIKKETIKKEPVSHA